jgi:hypothetical protein
MYTQHDYNECDGQSTYAENTRIVDGKDSAFIGRMTCTPDNKIQRRNAQRTKPILSFYQRYI